MNKIKRLIEKNGNFYTKNQEPGEKVYGEKLLKESGEEYRRWSVNKSKLANLLSKGFELDLKDGDNILYLGAGSGTTISHLSDLFPQSDIYGIEYSEKSLKKLINRLGTRKNVFPILGDAREPESYKELIGPIDFIYQDITQKNQSEIFNKNARYFLKKNYKAILILKARSIDVKNPPKEVFEREIKELRDFDLIDKYRLDPIHKHHLALFLEYRGQDLY